MQQKQSLSTRYIWIVTGMFVVLAIAFAIYTWSEKQIDRANDLRLQSFLLADELRQSSEDLTRMARSYVETGDPLYKKYYQSILAIRDGKQPRPEKYHNIYWDLVLANKIVPDNNNGPAIALLDLMRKTGFVDEEFRKLEEAKAKSDTLTSTEFEAMKLVESTDSQAETNRPKARQMLNDDKYNQAKGAIMAPIHDFYQLMEKRTLEAVLAAEKKAFVLRIIFIVFALIMMLMMLMTNKLLSSILGDTVDEIFTNTNPAPPGKLNRFFFTLAVISLAAALRLWPLQTLGTSLVWLTFYPAVMVISLYGGLFSGLLGTALASLIAIFLGPVLVGGAFITRTADWLGMCVFILTGTMISCVSEAMLRANARAKKAQLQAEHANQAKSVFLSNMSHELRTPLNAILGFSNMMRNDPQMLQAHRENLDIINSSGEHLLTLINDVLEMAKIEAGRLQVEKAPFDLGNMVRDVTDMMQLRAQERGLQLLVEQSSEFPRYIMGDEVRLRQVLINLVGNAIKFTKLGGVTVRFGIKPNIMPQRLLIEVEDTGPGINQIDQEKVFEPFLQIGESAMQKGTGLGLTISRQFVQLMGGSLTLDSTLGVGSLFRLELPAKRVDASDVTRSEHAVIGEVVGLAPNQPEYRILIVEDQLENQLLLTKLMENLNFPVKVAENGAEGVLLFQSWRPHLIWMDWRMPVMDGLEATRCIREMPGGQDVKIVAVTASVFAEQRDELLKVGMDDFVRKPYRFNEIYECLTKQLRVKYLYATPLPIEEYKAVLLTAKMMSVLPKNLRKELYEALQSLEDDRIKAIIGQIASYDAKLHKTLADLVANYDYPAILKVLQIN